MITIILFQRSFHIQLKSQKEILCNTLKAILVIHSNVWMNDSYLGQISILEIVVKLSERKNKNTQWKYILLLLKNTEIVCNYLRKLNFNLYSTFMSVFIIPLMQTVCRTIQIIDLISTQQPHQPKRWWHNLILKPRE